MGALAGLRIGLLGAGAMGEALAGGLLAAGVPGALVRATDPVAARREQVARAYGIEVGDDNAVLVQHSDVVVLAVKPGVVAAVLEALVERVGAAAAQPLWVSIAAGISLTRLAALLPAGARVVRAMPNTPALVRAGATAFAANAAATAADRAVALALFESVGMAWEAPDERLLDAVTGLSGSGPAYVFVFLEALADAGVRAGLPRDVAHRLACQTTFGAAKLALESGLHPGQLKDRVTSPGGTTIAGLARLEAGGLRAAIHDAVEAAARRSRELDS
ncbi:pyrroline-5-carboxylate reductase [Myxococcota bacterium]|nr:pyrroline-5-carboxylate reductase [Myxococcota bacterium]MCZ7619621.1 pyrroline-5-carboxylate reductase [Myxococcota bacterium]